MCRCSLTHVILVHDDVNRSACFDATWKNGTKYRAWTLLSDVSTRLRHNNSAALALDGMIKMTGNIDYM